METLLIVTALRRIGNGCYKTFPPFLSAIHTPILSQFSTVSFAFHSPILSQHSSYKFPHFFCNSFSNPFEASEFLLVYIQMAEFKDFLPIMAEKLGGAGLMAELCQGFCSLADPERGLITVESLRNNSAILGVESLTDSEIKAMVQEGDLDGDGALNEHEFCVLMVRMSPSFMAEADKWLQRALAEEFDEMLRDL